MTGFTRIVVKRGFQFLVQRIRLAAIGAIACLAVASAGRAETGGQRRTFLLDLEHLAVAKEAWRSGNRLITAEVDKLMADADQRLSDEPFAVPLSEPTNPSAAHVASQFNGLTSTSRVLGLAYYFTGEEKYAEKLALLLRIFFLDEATRMPPHIEYSEIVAGVSGGSFGLTELADGLANEKLFDMVGLLEASPHWTRADREALQQWARDFRQWADESPMAQQQRSAPDNTGTNYDFVLTLLALYSGDSAQAQAHYMHYVTNRMPGQIAEDGSNPLEMQRPNNFRSHRYNLGRALDLAALGRHAEGVNLLTYETGNRRGLRRAVDYLLPYMVGDRQWDRYPGEAFGREEPAIYYELLRRAALLYRDPTLLAGAHAIGDASIYSIDLTHPEIVVYDKYWRGDANLDQVFDSADLMLVFAQGKYEQQVTAYWESGDWNGDRRFDSQDLIEAFSQGIYETGARRLAAR